MYWSFKQQLAHHSINGCNMRPGDLCGSGTISGEDKSSVGSLLEKTMNGKEPLVLADGLERTFIQDGDTLTITGKCEKLIDGKKVRIGFGECSGTIMRAAFSAKQ